MTCTMHIDGCNIGRIIKRWRMHIWAVSRRRAEKHRWGNREWRSEALHAFAQVGEELLVGLGLAQTLQELLRALSVEFLVVGDHVHHAAQ